MERIRHYVSYQLNTPSLLRPERRRSHETNMWRSPPHLISHPAYPCFALIRQRNEGERPRGPCSCSALRAPPWNEIAPEPGLPGLPGCMFTHLPIRMSRQVVKAPVSSETQNTLFLYCLTCRSGNLPPAHLPRTPCHVRAKEGDAAMPRQAGHTYLPLGSAQHRGVAWRGVAGPGEVKVRCLSQRTCRCVDLCVLPAWSACEVRRRLLSFVFLFLSQQLFVFVDK